jgi:hypothetical protein
MDPHWGVLRRQPLPEKRAGAYTHLTETHITFLSLCARVAAIFFLGFLRYLGGAEPWTDEKRKPQHRAVKMLLVSIRATPARPESPLTKASGIRPQPDLQMAWTVGVP